MVDTEETFTEFKKLVGSQQELDAFKTFEERRKQLVLEKNADADREKDYRIKLAEKRYDFWKYFLGTFLIGLFTTLTTAVFKNFELRMQQRKEDIQNVGPYMTQYLAILDKDGMKFDRAFYMAEFLSQTIVAPDLKAGFSNLRDSYAARMKQNRDSTNKLVADISKTKTELSKAISVQQNIPVAQRDQKIDSLVNVLERNLQVLQVKKNETVKESAKTFDNPPISPPKPSDPKYEVIYDDDRFTGQGYFSLIIDGIVVNVDAFKDKRTAASMRVEKDDAVIATFSLDVGGTKNIVTDDKKYKISISLQTIAGVANRANYHIKVERKLTVYG